MNISMIYNNRNDVFDNPNKYDLLTKIRSEELNPSTAILYLSNELHFLFNDSHPITTSPEILWDAVINFFLTDYKQHPLPLSSPHHLIELTSIISEHLTRKTFFTIERSVFLVEYYIPTFLNFFPPQTIISLADFGFANNSSCRCCSIANGYGIAQGIYQAMTKGSYDEQDWLRSAKVPYDKIDTTDGLFVNPKSGIEMIAHWVFVMMFNGECSQRGVMKMFKGLKAVNDGKEDLKRRMKDRVTCEIVNGCYKHLIGLVYHYRSVWDPESLTLFQWGLEAGVEELNGEKTLNRKVEQCVYNSSVRDGSVKTQRIAIILKAYLKAVLPQKSKKEGCDCTVMYCIFNCLFTTTYSQLMRLTSCFYKNFTNMNYSTRKIVYDHCIKFIEYSMFIIDYLKSSHEIVKSMNDSLKYNCLYIYIQYAGFLISIHPFLALFSCYFLKEIITLFSFSSSSMAFEEGLLPKVLFNFLAILYQITKSYNFNCKGQLTPFLQFILKQIPTNASSLYNSDWYFLSIGMSSIIPGFEVSLWYDNPVFLVENIKEITHRIQYVRQYEADMLLHHLNVIIDNDDYYWAIVNDDANLRKINQMLSYVLFNYDCIRTDEIETNFFNCDQFNKNIFGIINKLNMMDIDEYFYLPKKYDDYCSFEGFIAFIQKKNALLINQSSLMPEELISSMMFIAEHSKGASAFAYSQSEEYLRLYLHNRSNTKNDSRKMTESLNDLLTALPNLSKSEANIINELISSNLYHIDIALYIITSLISLNGDMQNIVPFLTGLLLSETKIEFTYFLSIIKFFSNFLITEYDRIDIYLRDKCNNDYHINALLTDYDLQSLPQKVHRAIPKEIIASLALLKTRKGNWEGKVLGDLHCNNVFERYIAMLNERNYPKSCLNLAEWKIYNDMREANCTSLQMYKSPKVIYCYYNSLSCLDDNGVLLEQFFMDKGLESFLFDYCEKNGLTLPQIKGTDANNKLLAHAELYLITLNRTQLNNVCMSYNNDVKGIDVLSLYICVSKLRTINVLFTSELYSIYEADYRKINLQIASFIRKSFNKMQEEAYGKMTTVAILYDLSVIVSAIDKVITKPSVSSMGQGFDDTVKLKLPNTFLGETLRHMITQRPLALISKHLLQLKIRRALCAMALETQLELQCLVDIMKIYRLNHSKEMLSNYFNEFKFRIITLIKTNPSAISIEMLYICIKYHLEINPLHNYEFTSLYNHFLSLSISDPTQRAKFEIVELKSKLASRFRMDESMSQLKERIIYLTNHPSKSNNEEYCIKGNLYCELLVRHNQSAFEQFSPKDCRIGIESLFSKLFEWLNLALKICILTTNAKLVTVYLPQLINYVYKIQKIFLECNMSDKALYASHSKVKKTMNTKSSNKPACSSLNKAGEYKEEYDMLVIEMKMLPRSHIQIILPQLLICYSLPNTQLYQLAIDLLVNFTNEKIDIASCWLAAFLSTNDHDIDAMCVNKIGQNQRGVYYRLYSQSRTFADCVKRKLSEGNQRIIGYYEKFQGMIKDLFLLVRKKGERHSEVAVLIQQINAMIRTSRCLLILPIVSNVNGYNAKIREDISEVMSQVSKPKLKGRSVTIGDLKQYDTLFITEVAERVSVIQSKETPMKITFYAKTAYDILNKEQSKSKGNDYLFLLKGDVVDITKELKSAELFNEINSVFKLKFYDITHQMSLQQYLISPITSHIVLVEWLIGTQTFSNIFDDMRRKAFIEPIKQRNTKMKQMDLGEFRKIKENTNVLYLYYQLHFPNPNDWWKAKKAYVISSAVWSMTCFFGGVGDRHPGNIMIGGNGEVIHIDFGYVLGKGMILPIPEIVPFRFTKNLRRNLGVLEENGLFVYIAKKTIDLFKEYYTPLISRIEYFLFDPYSNDSRDNRYMLNKIRELQMFFMQEYDYDHSQMKVYRLIQESKDDHNLVKMYYGWGAEI